MLVDRRTLKLSVVEIQDRLTGWVSNVLQGCMAMVFELPFHQMRKYL